MVEKDITINLIGMAKNRCALHSVFDDCVHVVVGLDLDALLVAVDVASIVANAIVVAMDVASIAANAIVVAMDVLGAAAAIVCVVLDVECVPNCH